MLNHFQPNDLKTYSRDQLNVLCDEIREKIKDTVLNCGGHLSSNLGVVELTVAMHYVFDFPKDKVVFDVGHQCYPHKILSGRYDKFETLRQQNGLSGFPKREESEYDCYNTGHAGTSVSAALGIAKARDIKGENYNVIALIGDGSFNNGLIYEAFNSVNILNTNFLLILNDNGMSISPTVGSMHGYLDDLKRGSIQNLEFFKNFGFEYVGIRNANDLNEMLETMREVKEKMQHSSVILHVVSQKGRGYQFCEDNPAETHGMAPLGSLKTVEYSEVFGETLTELADRDKRIVAVTAAMTGSLGLNPFFERHPDRAFDVGICEEHACVLCSAFAAEGLKPYYAIYSTFLQRAYDEIVIDACAMKLPVTFCIDRAGISGSDGETHQGVFDLAYLLPAPNLTIAVPKDREELKKLLVKSAAFEGPLAIRYPRESKLVFNEEDFEWGTWEVLDESSSNVAVLAVGERMITLAKRILHKLQAFGKSFTLINARFVKPMDEKMLSSLSQDTILTMEDGMKQGGFGEAIAAYYCNTEKEVLPFAYEDAFIPHGTVAALAHTYGVDCDEIERAILDALQ